MKTLYLVQLGAAQPQYGMGWPSIGGKSYYVVANSYDEAALKAATAFSYERGNRSVITEDGSLRSFDEDKNVTVTSIQIVSDIIW